MTTYRIPKIFYDDHRNRDLPSGNVLKALARHYVVELTDDEKDELLSDARFYAHEAMYMHPQLPGLMASSKATIAALGRPEMAS